MSEEKNKNIVTESKCDRCGNTYPEFNVVKNGEVVNRGYYPDCECVVQIQLIKWQIPILLGAASLGKFFEEICSNISKASEFGRAESQTCEADSQRWREHASFIIDQIKSQTGINLKYCESANKENILSTIKYLVDKEINKREEKYFKLQVDREWLRRGPCEY